MHSAVKQDQDEGTTAGAVTQWAPETAEQRAKGAEHAVELLLRSIRLSIDAGKVITCVPISGDPTLCAIALFDNGATLERRVVDGRWQWVKSDTAHASQLDILNVMTGGQRVRTALEHALATRYSFNQAFSGAFRHTLQAFAREQRFRYEIEFAQEDEGQFVRPMGVTVESSQLQTKLDVACTVTNGTIAELADQLFDALLTAGTGAAHE